MDMLESSILHDCRKTQRLITLFLMNGFQLRGYVSAIDENCIELVSEDGNRKLIYKHAISTINLGGV